MTDILVMVRTSAAREILYLPHALLQMARPERRIRRVEVDAVVQHGDVIENYPEDVRGHSCLMLGHGQNGRPVHVVCAPRPDYLAVVTAYLPDPDQWDAEFRRRK